MLVTHKNALIQELLSGIPFNTNTSYVNIINGSASGNAFGRAFLTQTGRTRKKYEYCCFLLRKLLNKFKK